MKRNAKDYYLLRLLYRSLIFYTISLIFYLGSAESPVFALKAMLIALPVSVITWSGLELDSMLYFLLATLLSFLPIILLLGLSNEAYILIQVSLGAFFLAYYERSDIYRELIEVNKPYPLIVFIIAYGLSLISGASFYTNLIYVAGMLYIVLFLVLKNYNRRDKYFNNNKVNIQERELDSINRVNSLSMKALISIIIVIMLLGSIPRYSFNIGKAFSRAYDKIIEAIEDLISFDSWDYLWLKQKASNKQRPLFQEAPEGQLLGDVVAYVAIGLAALGVLIILTVVIYFVIRKLLDILHKTRPKAPPKSLANGMVILEEESYIKERPNRRKEKRFDLSINGRIRSRYKKLILGTGAEIERHYTPEQAEEAAFSRKEEAAVKYIPILHSLYEKARYSKEGCTKEDYSKMVQTIHSLEKERDK